MTIKARTVYTKDLLNQFIKFNFLKKPGQIVINIVLILLLLCMLCLSISPALIYGNFESIFIFLGLFILIVPTLFIISFFLPKLLNKKLIGAVNTYEFSDSGIVIESTLPTVTGQVKANYSYLKTVYETNTNFYLFISRQQAYLMNKSDITEGTVSELHELLTKNIPAKKYIFK